jgi:hypothetical protein
LVARGASPPCPREPRLPRRRPGVATGSGDCALVLAFPAAADDRAFKRAHREGRTRKLVLIANEERIAITATRRPGCFRRRTAASIAAPRLRRRAHAEPRRCAAACRARARGEERRTPIHAQWDIGARASPARTAGATACAGARAVCRALATPRALAAGAAPIAAALAAVAAAARRVRRLVWDVGGRARRGLSQVGGTRTGRNYVVVRCCLRAAHKPKTEAAQRLSAAF